MAIGHEKLDVYRLDSRLRKIELDRMAAMLTRLGRRGYEVQEDGAVFGFVTPFVEPDFDFDFDPDETRS